jgi:hypothetical protein
MPTKIVGSKRRLPKRSSRVHLLFRRTKGAIRRGLPAERSLARETFDPAREGASFRDGPRKEGFKLRQRSSVEGLDKSAGKSKMAEIPRACPIVRAQFQGHFRIYESKVAVFSFKPSRAATL